MGSAATLDEKTPVVGCDVGVGVVVDSKNHLNVCNTTRDAALDLVVDKVPAVVGSISQETQTSDDPAVVVVRRSVSIVVQFVGRGRGVRSAKVVVTVPVNVEKPMLGSTPSCASISSSWKNWKSPK